MGLLKELLLLPAAPVRLPIKGTFWTLDQVLDTAEREYYDPDRIRGELAALSRDLDEGRITPEEFDREEDALLDLLEEAQGGGPPPVGESEGEPP